MEKYFFLVLVAALLFVLLFWFKKTPRAESKADSEKRLFEHESKIVRLYQNLEDLMNSFESYVEEEKRGIHADREQIGRMATEAREASERITRAMGILGAMNGAKVAEPESAPQDAPSENETGAEAGTDAGGETGGKAETAARAIKPRATKARASRAETATGAAAKVPSVGRSATSRVAAAPQPGAVVSEMPVHVVPMPLEEGMKERQNVNWVEAKPEARVGTMQRAAVRSYTAAINTKASAETIAFMEIAELARANMKRGKGRTGGNAEVPLKQTVGTPPVQGAPRDVPRNASLESIPGAALGDSSGELAASFPAPMDAIPDSRPGVPSGATLSANVDSIERVELPTEEAFQPLSVPRARRKKPATGEAQPPAGSAAQSSASMQTPEAGTVQTLPAGIIPLAGSAAHTASGVVARGALGSAPRKAAVRKPEKHPEPALDAHELLRLLTADAEQTRKAETGESSLVRKTEQATRLYNLGTAPEEIARALKISLTEVKMLLGLPED